MNYSDRIKLLVDKGVIDSSTDAFFPDGGLYGGDLLKLSDFFQDYLESAYNFQTPIFFFGVSNPMNAWASNYKGLDVVCIDISVIETFRNLVKNNQEIIHQLLVESEVDISYDNGLGAWHIMAECVEMFLFYHETAHLIQLQDPPMFNVYIDEKSEGNSFQIDNHVGEFDSDLYASVKIASHIGLIAKRQKGLTTDEAKKKHLEDLCIITITAYAMYRLLLFPNYGDFYTKEKDYPHILMRIILAIIHITKALVDNFKIDKQRVISKTMALLSQIGAIIPEVKSTKSFREMGQKHFEDVLMYFHELNQIVVSSNKCAHVKTQKKRNT